MKNDLKEYFKPLFIFCKILGLFPVNFDDKDNIFDLFCTLPIHIFFSYSVYRYIIRSVKPETVTATFIYVDYLFILFFFTSDIILFVNNFRIRKRIKNIFVDLKCFEMKNLRFVKRRKLKLNIFLFTVSLIFVVFLDLLNRKFSEGYSFFIYTAHSFPLLICFTSNFIIGEILYITRNLFCKVNELLILLNQRRININYIIILSQIHYDLVRFVNELNDIFTVSLLICSSEMFLQGLILTFSFMGITRKILLGQTTLWRNCFFPALWAVLITLSITCLCSYWDSIKKEVSNLNIYFF